METRFATDGALYPNRVIVGSETHPAAIGTAWAAVREHAHVIGDFTWTGWDYLGEAGIGRTEYGEPGSAVAPQSFLGEYPWLTAWCGDIDITGHRRPQSYYREIVFGLRADPYLAVERPEHHGKVAAGTPWSWGDVVSSWSWAGHEGAPVTVEVYADADEVELVVNGRSVGRLPSGAAQRFRSKFETVYEPGLLEAVAWHDGVERGRTALRTATGSVRLAAGVDRPVIAADPGDLSFVTLTLLDARERSIWDATGASTSWSTGPACSRPWAVRIPVPRRASAERAAPRSTVGRWPSSGRRAGGGSPSASRRRGARRSRS